MVAGAIVLPPPRRRLGATVLEATGLGASLPSGRVLFRDLEFSLPPGGIVGVVGRNGCGKTSLFNLIAKGAGQEELILGGHAAAAPAAASVDSAAQDTAGASAEEGVAAGAAGATAAAAVPAWDGPVEVGRVKVGESVSLGLVSQGRGGLDPHLTVLEAISEGDDVLTFGDRKVKVSRTG